MTENENFYSGLSKNSFAIEKPILFDKYSF